MSLSNFKRAVEIGRLSEADREWFPRWFASYADFVSRMVPVAVGTEVIQIGSPRVPTDDNANLPINQSLVIGFLRTLRDKGVEHWRRLQAARAIAYYHAILVRDEAMDFKPIIEKPSARRRNLTRCPSSWGQLLYFRALGMYDGGLVPSPLPYLNSSHVLPAHPSTQLS